MGAVMVINQASTGIRAIKHRLYATGGVALSALIVLFASMGDRAVAAADPEDGAFFARSQSGAVTAFLHVKPFGLRQRISTAAIQTKGTCISDGASGTTSERIGVNGKKILVGRDGRFSYYRRFDDDPAPDYQRIVTYRIRGEFTTPRHAKGKASVSILIRGPGLSTVTCGGKRDFSVRKG